MHKCSDCKHVHDAPRARRASGAPPLNFPTEVRADLRNMRGLGARVAESVRWSA